MSDDGLQEEKWPEVSKRGRPKAKGKEEVSGPKPIGLEIEYESGKQHEAAEQAFFEGMDELGGLTIVNEVCGGSIRVKQFSEFPKANVRCTCGKPGHFAIKYTLKK